MDAPRTETKRNIRGLSRGSAAGAAEEQHMGPDLGQVGYEAYAKSTGGKTFDGRAMPTWEQVCAEKPHVAKAWRDAAEAIKAA